VRVPSLRLTGRLGAVVGAQSGPMGGVLGGWSPATGLVLYWAEAVIGVLLALAMVALYRWRMSDPRLDAALGTPGSPAAEAARLERLADLQRPTCARGTSRSSISAASPSSTAIFLLFAALKTLYEIGVARRARDASQARPDRIATPPATAGGAATRIATAAKRAARRGALRIGSGRGSCQP